MGAGGAVGAVPRGAGAGAAGDGDTAEGGRGLGQGREAGADAGGAGGPKEAAQEAGVEDEDGGAERGDAAVVHLGPVTVQAGGEIEEGVDDEGVEEGDEGELEEEFVDGGAQRGTPQEDQADGDGGEEEVDDGAGGGDDDPLGVRELRRVVADETGEPVVAPAEDAAAEGEDGDGVAEFVEGDGDGDEDEEGGLVDEGAVGGGEAAVERLAPAAGELRDDADAEDGVEEAQEGEGAEVHGGSFLRWVGVRGAAGFGPAVGVGTQSDGGNGTENRGSGRSDGTAAAGWMGATGRRLRPVGRRGQRGRGGGRHRGGIPDRTREAPRGPSTGRGARKRSVGQGPL